MQKGESLFEVEIDKTNLVIESDYKLLCEMSQILVMNCKSVRNRLLIGIAGVIALTRCVN